MFAFIAPRELSEEEAKKLLNTSLKVKSSKKVYIPTDFGTEIHAYEYHCVAPDEKEILVKTKVISVDVMDLDQAIANMTMLGHDFYIYKDSENENYAVVYRRRNGGYGLIEVE